jgi:CheY-like chemotaxis protein
MNGQISVKSEVGVGTTFDFHVTLKPVRTEDLVHSPSKINVDAALPSGIKILLADDSPENRELVKLFLKKYSPQIVEAENGADAFDQFQHDRFDVVLMDMQMPIVDGYNATRKIREFEDRFEKPRTPVIAITAHAMKEDSERCIRVGCNDYVPKPINRAELIHTILNHLSV